MLVEVEGQTPTDERITSLALTYAALDVNFGFCMVSACPAILPPHQGTGEMTAVPKNGTCTLLLAPRREIGEDFRLLAIRYIRGRFPTVRIEMPKSIPSDSTIESVWPHLTHQKQYVSGVLQKMRRCKAENGASFVRIGVTGTGQKPYYRVFFKSEDGTEKIFGSYYDNHDPLENGFAQTYNWSTEHMDFESLLNFYADKIGFQGKRQ